MSITLAVADVNRARRAAECRDMYLHLIERRLIEDTLK